MVFIYQMENWCYVELNRACRYKNHSKILSLGPWAYAMSVIVSGAQRYRDKMKYDCSKEQNLWLCESMTLAEFKDYQMN